MDDDRVLRARAREAMKTGNLPHHRPEGIWGGLGSGGPCAVCDKAVDKEDVELELQFNSDGKAGTIHYHVHARCFAAWELERRMGGSNGHSLPRSDDGGIMGVRELNTAGQEERG
jgi:hypothetical protein